ncbi:MAG TPA: hypothetical protein VJL33_00960 [Candidatus Bathyarchaeia archaeon]|nr:hypothetical protein [Candidatus Bathyarchaeia archaeon]
MAQVAIEYMIMIPILIAQIFLFPMVASAMMNNWVDSRRTIVIQEVASNLSSSMQQLYSSLNHETISAGTVTNELDLPRYIEDYPYKGNASLRTIGSNGSRILEITLSYVGDDISTTALATFGANMEWMNSTFLSNSTSAGIIAEKQLNGTIRMYFG